VDRSTVDFLLGEGVPELVSLRTTEFPAQMMRHPSKTPDSPGHYLRSYVPDGKEPYRSKLFAQGYEDGLNLSHHIQLRTGMRGVRALLYRPPPREVLFDPEVLATVDLEDPPDPDAVFGFLSPAVLTGAEIRVAVDPGRNRNFATAYASNRRADGCLLGYVAEVGAPGEPAGRSRYALFVADPDNDSPWIEEQADGLRALSPATVEEKDTVLPVTGREQVPVKTLRVPLGDGSVFLRAATDRLVVLAQETKPTKNLEERVLLALRVLYVQNPKPKLYDAALAAARDKRKEPE
jgi:hypothetical protein